MAQKAHGKAEKLADAFEKAGDEAKNWVPKGHEHKASVEIEVTLKPNPGAIKEYRVTLIEK